MAASFALQHYLKHQDRNPPQNAHVLVDYSKLHSDVTTLSWMDAHQIIVEYMLNGDEIFNQYPNFNANHNIVHQSSISDSIISNLEDEYEQQQLMNDIKENNQSINNRINYQHNINKTNVTGFNYYNNYNQHILHGQTVQFNIIDDEEKNSEYSLSTLMDTANIIKPTVHCQTETRSSNKLYIVPYRSSEQHKYYKRAICKKFLHITIIILFLILISCGLMVLYLYVLPRSEQHVFDVKAKCVVINEWIETNTSNWYYEWEVVNVSVCTENKTFTLFEPERDKYNVSDYLSCWTDSVCSQLLLSYKDESQTYVESRFIDLWICGCAIGALFLFVLVVRYLRRDVNDKNCETCCSYMRGHDVYKYIYYESEWDKLDKITKFDYYIGFYCREFNINLGDDVYHLLYDFFDKEDVDSDDQLSSLSSLIINT